MRTSLILAAVTIALCTAGSAARGQGTPPAAQATVSLPANAPSRDEVLKLGRITFERAFASNIDALVASADPAVGNLDSLRARLTAGLQQLNDQLGPEVKTISEKVMIVNDGVQYWRESEYTAVPVPITFRVVVSSAGKWRGFAANTEVPAGKELLP
jgi:hypothetical protein